jgi:DNA repair protein RecO (recombination protein O)
MALERTAAIVIGGFPLGESDRAVTFYTREQGRVRGVARGARRMRSRFGGALELFTLGDLVYFDTGRSELVRIDHFDVTEPFAPLRDDLDRLGHASWIVECVTRLTAERDRHPALYGLLLRSLRTMTSAPRPARVAIGFAVRALDVLGYRPRLDGCGGCGRRYPFPAAALEETGVICGACARAGTPATPLSAAAVGALGRLRAARWEEGLAFPLGRTETELRAVLESHMSRLIGHPTRSAKFLREVQRLTGVSGDRS